MEMKTEPIIFPEIGFRDLAQPNMSLQFEVEFTVNKQKITVFEEPQEDGESIYHFPTLYHVDKRGRTNFWEIKVRGNTYTRFGGIEGGKVKSWAPMECHPKNVGRANETTPFEQALFTAQSKWNKKRDQGYDPEEEEATEEKEEGKYRSSPLRLRPMLAQKYETRAHDLRFPAGASPKLDGIRALVQLYSPTGEEKDLQVQITSRLNKEYPFLTRIREEVLVLLQHFGPKIILDGELYSHSLAFNLISGAARAKNRPSPQDDLIEFWIFDLYLPDEPDLSYKERAERLREMEAFCSSRGQFEAESFSNLRFVTYHEVNSHEEIPAFHTRFVSEGYEGLMLRNLDAPYLLGYRTENLLKYKDFVDEEFQVVDVEQGKGTEEGAVVFVCETSEGERFTVRPRGSIAKRRWQLEHRDLYVGKMLTVRYQPDLREKNLPRFPVGIKFPLEVTNLEAVDFRDYE